MKTPSHGSPMLTSTVLGFVTIAGILTAGCDRVDQKKFDAVYRAGKTLEVDMQNIGVIDVAESEKLVKQLQTETKLLDGRTSGQREVDAVRAYNDGADAYKHFLVIRSLDLQGDNSRNGRMLLGDGWVAIAAKYHLAVEAAANNSPSDKYKFYWVNTSDAVTIFTDAGKKALTDASRLVNGQS